MFYFKIIVLNAPQIFDLGLNAISDDLIDRF